MITTTFGYFSKISRGSLHEIVQLPGDSVMDYPLENLDPERFQEFCQALLAREYPGMQCFPVAQPDGGRDAWIHRRGSEKARPALFQVKFVRRADLTAEAHQRLVETMKAEVAKLDPAMLKGVERYIVLTNIAGTAHPEVGSIDKLQKVLDDGLPVPGEVWWRNDIARRLDTAWDVKWAYPEVMSGQDLLRALVESGLKEEQSRRSNAIRAFLGDQYRADQEVKFKQVELQNRLVDLFVDVPASPPRHRSDRRAPSSAMIAHSRVAYTYAAAERGDRQVTNRELHSEEAISLFPDDRPVGAASLLLHAFFQAAVPKVVLEGAPGQGKSTIGQYVCQVHRARLLERQEMLSQLPLQHTAGPVRLPFRIDLRDLATWLARRDPFDVENEGEPPHWHKSLEGFLCGQVRQGSGGVDFSVSDLQAVLRVSSLLLVFDGLDEVADVERRREVVDEITRATTRLKDMTLSLQVVVTSRPAAFTNSPGPSETEFPYFHLDSLPHTLIVDYSERWLKAKQMSDREAADLRKLLREKLDQPHMRDLARNPMQLTILLSLMHTRGASLPDKRTALYDNYVDLFFSREAEKSPTVREHRDLLIGIHGHLAWLLHGEAQEGRNSGSITDERLREVVRAYLLVEGHETALVDILFAGMVERVVALVSRVQGTYEFEVQPLREYFAARYLYETAPYSPVGRERRGTRPDRFDALARDFYWLNVTRFYAGCFSKGELPSLVDRLEVLLAEPPFLHTAHPRVLAAMLLADWVFAQHPRSVTTLVKLILDGVGLRAIAAALNQRARAPAVLVLPKSSGRDDVVGRAFAVLEQFPPRDYGMELVDVLRSNGTLDLLEQEWRSRMGRLAPHRVPTWVKYGQYLGILPQVTDRELLSLCSPLQPQVRMQVLFSAGRAVLYAPEGDSEAEDALVGAILELDVHGRVFRPAGGHFERLATVVEPARYCIGVRRNEPYPLRTSWRQFGDDGRWLDEPPVLGRPFDRVLQAVAKATQRPSSEWATSLVPWSSVVDSLLAVRPRAWSAVALACVAAGVVSPASPDGAIDDFFDASAPLCPRMRAARLRAGQAGWWSRTLQSAVEPKDVMMAILTASVWASGKTLIAVIADLEEAVSRLDDDQWKKVADTVTSIQWHTRNFGNGRLTKSRFVAEVPVSVSERTLPLFVSRGSADARQSLYERRLAAYRGTHRVTLEAAQTVAFELMGGERCDWTRELAVVAHAYEHGVLGESVLVDRFYRHARSESRIPRDIAARIVEGAEKYPSMLVQAAQIVCAAAAAKELVSVGSVARRDRWFEDT